MAKIFMVSYGGGHVNMLSPIYQKLKENSNHTVVYLALNSSIKYFNDNELDYKELINYSHLFENNVISKIGDSMLLDNHNDNLGISKELSKFSLGLNYIELENYLGYDDSKYIYSLFGRQSFLPIEAAKKILIHENPDMIITTNSPKFERAFHLASISLNIKSIILTDLFSKFDIFHYSVDKIYVMSKITFFNLYRKGYLSSQIEITGNPAFDKNIIPIDKVKNKILIATQNDIHKSSFIKFISILVKSFTNFDFYLRKHPNDLGKEEQKLILSNDNVFESTKTSIAEELADSYFLIAKSSTSIIDAISMNVIPFSFKINSEDDRLDFIKYGLSEGFETLNDLKNLIVKYSNEKIRNEYLSSIQSLLYLDNKSTSRIIKSIYDILESI